MTDHDADEIVKQPLRQDRMPTVDKTLIATGITLAALATIFPWYAFFNQDKFAMPTLWQGSTRDLPAKVGLPEADAAAVARAVEMERKAAVDTIVTATAPTERTDGEPAGSALDQPFPSASSFKLVHVANGRALIEDESGMYIVRVGSALPDNSRLSTLEERDGRWVMITSNGDVFKAE